MIQEVTPVFANHRYAREKINEAKTSLKDIYDKVLEEPDSLEFVIFSTTLTMLFSYKKKEIEWSKWMEKITALGKKTALSNTCWTIYQRKFNLRLF